MDEFEFYCQIARSSGNQQNLCPKSANAAHRIRSRSLHPMEFDKENEKSSRPSSRRESLQAEDIVNADKRKEFPIPSPTTHPKMNNSSPRFKNESVTDTKPIENRNIYRVRSFKRTSKGVISKGDSIRTKSNSSLDECLNECENKTYPHPTKDKTHPAHPKLSMMHDKRCQSHTSGRRKLTSFTIQLVGAPLVGKSSLCEQFLNPDFLDDSYIPNLDQNSRTLTVELDGKEWTLTFMDTAKDEDEDPNMIQLISNADGYMIVYGIDDYASFEFAKTILQYIWGEILPSSALFLVANKSDLERGREVSSEEGKHLAKQYDCQFLEISTVLNHMVNDLIVKFIQRISHQKEKFQKDKKDQSHHNERKSKGHTNSITNFFRKHFYKHSSQSSTIENH